MIAADLATLDVEHGALTVTNLGGGELVGLENRHEAIHTRLALEAEAFDVDVLLDVADRADYGQPGALDRVRDRAGMLNFLYDRVNLLIACGLLHHDHHRFFLSITPGMLEVPVLRQGIARRALDTRLSGARSLSRILCGSRHPLTTGPGRSA